MYGKLKYVFSTCLLGLVLSIGRRGTGGFDYQWELCHRRSDRPDESGRGHLNCSRIRSHGVWCELRGAVSSWPFRRDRAGNRCAQGWHLRFFSGVRRYRHFLARQFGRRHISSCRRRDVRRLPQSGRYGGPTNYNRTVYRLGGPQCRDARIRNPDYTGLYRGCGPGSIRGLHFPRPQERGNAGA